jgi:cation diffusion facilitator CzcD-associated flavoprotein CzcO
MTMARMIVPSAPTPQPSFSLRKESDAIGGNWVFREETDRASVYESTHIISSRKFSAFDDFPMPPDYPVFPSHRQVLAYFQSYADAFGLRSHIRFHTRVTHARPTADGKWLVCREGPHGAGEELFDYLMVCSGHHREPSMPSVQGNFAGLALHSCAYRRPDPFRGKEVLVVGAGNSACDIAVDVSRLARRTCISMRRIVHIMPNFIFGHPVDVAYAWIRLLPKPMVPAVLRGVVRLFVGPYRRYGLEQPAGTPVDRHPTLNSRILEALRDGRIQPRPGIDRLDGDAVNFRDGRSERFDAIIWGTGFRPSFPFLPASVVDWEATRRPPLYLKMMHKTLPNIFFIGLFQPNGCIWRLADHQARIAVGQISGRLTRPSDIEARIAREMSSPHWRFDETPRHAIEVDALDFRHELLSELAPAGTRRPRWTLAHGRA